MSSTTPNLGDAVRPDGSLKDASEIPWSFDADETIPFPSDTSRPPSRAPAAVLAGARRVSTRVPRPSRCAVEAAEATSSGSTGTHLGTKCKAQSDPDPDRRVTRKVVINLVDDVADPDDDGATTEPATELADDDGATTEPATELADDDYKSIRAMADADNQVVSVRSQEMRTADIHVIFRAENNYLDPDTGEILKGNMCMVCHPVWSFGPESPDRD
ncbi:hypothetical protein EDB89DRAFT_1913507 [Lactarius sanguifluus]|nr:hypothetical protein EDB89DRAFT_1913507 [Lactarius sanguifluus]